jgi:hypothetical protein
MIQESASSWNSTETGERLRRWSVELLTSPPPWNAVCPVRQGQQADQRRKA